MKKFIALFIIFQLLFNSVWASAHMGVDEHGAYESAHVHLDDHHEEQPAENSESTPDHDVDCHAHIFLFISSGTSPQTDHVINTPLFHDDSLFLSLYLTPPVPPPNA